MVSSKESSRVLAALSETSRALVAASSAGSTAYSDMTVAMGIADAEDATSQDVIVVEAAKRAASQARQAAVQAVEPWPGKGTATCRSDVSVDLFVQHCESGHRGSLGRPASDLHSRRRSFASLSEHKLADTRPFHGPRMSVGVCKRFQRSGPIVQVHFHCFYFFPFHASHSLLRA